MRRSTVLALLTVCLSGAALAQTPTSPPGSGPYDVKEITFDSWCQTTQQYSADRCQARRPEDVKAFEDYRGAFEHYELDHLKAQQKDQETENATNPDATPNASGRFDATP